MERILKNFAKFSRIKLGASNGKMIDSNEPKHYCQTVNLQPERTKKNSFTLTDAKPNLCPAARLAGNREQSGEQRQANQGTSILIDSI
jgi:hypothetical protein